MYEYISQNPSDRLPSEMQAALTAGSPMFDVHCHIFNRDFVPDGFVGIRVPFRKKFLKDIGAILNNLNPFTDTDPMSNLAYFIDFLNDNTMEEILIKLFSYYPGDAIFCPLLMDMSKGIKGALNRPYTEQLHEIKKLCEKYPHKLLPFVAIDPTNPDALTIFEKTFSKEFNFFGVKIYPALGYLPSHPLLMKIFAICEEKNIPITAHCGNGEVRYNKGFFIKNIDGITSLRDPAGSYIPYEKPFNKLFLTNNQFRTFFNTPANWAPVLARFKKLRINFAHFGSGPEWIKFAEYRNNTYVSKIIDFMQTYENVYADISYDIYNKKIFDVLRSTLSKNKRILERTLYGSDYYMVVKNGHFRSIKTDFVTAMGDEIMQQIAYKNPRKFLGI